PSDKYRLQRLASRDLKAAIQPSVGATPPENMAMRILEQYEEVNYSMGDIQIDTIPSDEKFYFHPFTQTDIQKALEKIRSTAAGPDGLNGRAAQTIPVNIWRIFFNKLLDLKCTPNSWSNSRVSLIDKDSGRDSLETLTTYPDGDR
ncbi:hypothetical protein ADUPG1_003217, partial [Aduncisulcus paluster]